MASDGMVPGQSLPRSESNRTLFEIIREERGGSKESKKAWKSFKNKLHRTSSGSKWTSSVSVPASDIPLNSNSTKRSMSRQPSTRIGSDPTDQPDIRAVPEATPSLGRRASLARESPSGRFDLHRGAVIPSRRFERETDDEDDDEEDGEGTMEDEGGDGGGATEAPPVRMSLMSLLAETDSDGMFSYGDEEEDEEEERGREYYNCCVCMVRHIGTAFVPCGHSFCRLCSRELCVQGGNCPLCKNYILEILDIF